MFDGNFVLFAAFNSYHVPIVTGFYLFRFGLDHFSDQTKNECFHSAIAATVIASNVCESQILPNA